MNVNDNHSVTIYEKVMVDDEQSKEDKTDIKQSALQTLKSLTNSTNKKKSYKKYPKSEKASKTEHADLLLDDYNSSDDDVLLDVELQQIASLPQNDNNTSINLLNKTNSSDSDENDEELLKTPSKSRIFLTPTSTPLKSALKAPNTPRTTPVRSVSWSDIHGMPLAEEVGTVPRSWDRSSIETDALKRRRARRKKKQTRLFVAFCGSVVCGLLIFSALLAGVMKVIVARGSAFPAIPSTIHPTNNNNNNNIIINTNNNNHQNINNNHNKNNFNKNNNNNNNRNTFHEVAQRSIMNTLDKQLNTRHFTNTYVNLKDTIYNSKYNIKPAISTTTSSNEERATTASTTASISSILSSIINLKNYKISSNNNNNISKHNHKNDKSVDANILIENNNNNKNNNNNDDEQQLPQQPGKTPRVIPTTTTITSSTASIPKLNALHSEQWWYDIDAS